MKKLTSILMLFTMPALAANVGTVPNPFGTTSYNNGPTIVQAAKSSKTKKAKTSKTRTAPSATQSCASLPQVCYEMTSCAQAQAAYRCGNTRLDRDKDGIPCDNLCQ